MNISSALGLFSAFTFLLPVLLILMYRLLGNISLLAIAVYFLLSLVYNLMTENIIVVTPDIRKSFGALTNYLDLPLMFTAMLFFCRTALMRRAVITTLAAFLAYEVIISFKYGLQPNSSIYIMGAGIVLVFVFSFIFFADYIKQAVEQNKNYGKTLMIASISFTYGVYAIVYFFFYIQKTPGSAGVFILYYLASIIFSVVMSTGIICLRKEVAQKKVQPPSRRREADDFFRNKFAYKA